MKDYKQITLETASEEQKEILVAMLSAIGYEGFEEEKRMLKAFIPEDLFDENDVKAILASHPASYTVSSIAPRNWNESWETSFEPVVVDDFCSIRAEFHRPVPCVQHEIIITPKMSFGTGHHATTFMMIKAMRAIQFENKKVFDFGTGTGVLAILAEKCGAACIDAVDIDEWSIENAAENILRNASGKVNLQKAEKINDSSKYDIILANINRNIILQHLAEMHTQLEINGILLLSGLLKEDEAEIAGKACPFGLSLVKKSEQHNWICLQYVREK